MNIQMLEYIKVKIVGKKYKWAMAIVVEKNCEPRTNPKQTEALPTLKRTSNLTLAELK